jgi:hypothetical protein
LQLAARATLVASGDNRAAIALETASTVIAVVWRFEQRRRFMR